MDNIGLRTPDMSEVKEKKYKVTIRTHYGIDMHDYSHEVVNEEGLGKLLRKYPSKVCIGHTYDTPNDDITKVEQI